MPTLRQLLDAHAEVLVLDAASPRIQVGWLCRNQPPRWQTNDAEAGTAVFQAVQALGVDVNAVGAFVFCDGPGSILAVRTVAAAIRTWCVLNPRPVFGYASLALVAEALHLEDTSVISDARRDLWHLYDSGKSLKRVAASELPPRLVMPERFRVWSAMPPGVKVVPYDVAALLGAAIDLELLRETDSPEAFMHDQPAYATWTPQIHRAPHAP